jgi:hypothetical protein
MLVDPSKTTSMLKPIGKDSSLKTWPGDAWKIAKLKLLPSKTVKPVYSLQAM